MSATGRDVLEAVQRGESAAIEAFVREHEALVFSYSRRFLGDACDAEEIAQDTFVRAIRAVQTYSYRRIVDLAVRPWLLRIARNLALNRLRHDRSRPVAVADVADLESVLSGAEVNPGSSDAELEAAIERLDRSEREVVALRFGDDLSYAELAATVGCTESAARGRVFRALKRLRLILTERNDADVHLG